MPKVRASSGTIGTTSLPISGSRSSFDSSRTNTMVVERAPVGALAEFLEDLGIRRRRKRDRLAVADRERPAKRLPALFQVRDFRTLVVGPVVRRLADFFFGNRNAEALANRAQIVFGQLLLLMGDVLPFARVAQPVSFDGANQEDGRLPLVLDRGLVGVVNLHRIVPAERQLLQVVV